MTRVSQNDTHFNIDSECMEKVHMNIECLQLRDVVFPVPAL